MSGPTPSSIPTSHDPRSSRPTKRRALSPTSKQSAHLEALFANPTKAILSTSNPSSQTTNLPPEIVANVQGSSAGAGSGEFHVYKASRRREYERLKAMDEEKEKEEKDLEYEKERTEQEKKDLEKTEKNRLKREKARLRKEKAKGGKVDGGGEGEGKMPKFRPNVAVKSNEGAEEGTPVAEEQGIVLVDED